MKTDKELMVSQLMNKTTGKLIDHSELIDLYEKGELQDNGNFYQYRMVGTDHKLITSYAEIVAGAKFNKELHDKLWERMWNKGK